MKYCVSAVFFSADFTNSSSMLHNYLLFSHSHLFNTHSNSKEITSNPFILTIFQGFVCSWKQEIVSTIVKICAITWKQFGYYFRPHFIMGEENHHLCCVFFLNSSKSTISIHYLTILVASLLLTHTRSSEIRIVTYAHSSKFCIQLVTKIKEEEEFEASSSTKIVK